MALRWLVLDLYEAHDDFSQRLRKTASIALFLLSPALVGATVHPAMLWRDGAAASGAPVYVVFCCLAVVTVIANYIVLQARKHISDLQANVFFTALVACFLVMSFSFYTDARIGSGALAILVVLTRTSWQPVLLPLLFVTSLLWTYNDIEVPLGRPRMAFPGFGTGTVAFRISSDAACLLALVGSLLALVVQATEHSRQLKARQQVLDVANEVVDLLRRYDTEAVSTMLDAREAVALDKELIDSLRQMNQNLKLYRPHLPNYVLEEHSEDEDEMEESKKSARKSSDVLSSKSQPKSTSSRSDGPPEHASPSAAVDRKSWSHGLPRGWFEGKVTMATFDFRCLRDTPQVGQRMARLAHVVNTVFSEATVNKGSVHAWVGDAVVLTWNATHRVVQSELKAARLACRVSSAATVAGYWIAGAVFTGQARCEMAATSNGFQTQLVDNRAWRAALMLMLRLAVKYRAVLMDATTFLGCDMEVESRAIDAFAWHDPAARRHLKLTVQPSISMQEFSPTKQFFLDDAPISKTVIFQLMRERSRDDDEWMYQLQADTGKKTPHTECTAAVFHLLAGEYAAASEILLKLLQHQQIPARQGVPQEDAVLTALSRFCSLQQR